MRDSVAMVLAVGMALTTVACEQSSATAPDGPTPSQAYVSTPGVVQAPIEGMIVSLGNVGPDDVVSTPSGNCHFSHFDNQSEFSGDISGLVTFERRIMNFPCDFVPDGAGDPLNFSGAIHGTVTYDGRTGEIEGQGHGHCDYDPTSPALYSCGGVYNLFGSGDLSGVEFHVRWGPGWFPFPYEGTASTH